MLYDGVSGFDISEGLGSEATGLPSWMRAAPRPYSLGSVCITMGLGQSKYARVVLSNVLHIHCLSQ